MFFLVLRSPGEQHLEMAEPVQRLSKSQVPDVAGLTGSQKITTNKREGARYPGIRVSGYPDNRVSGYLNN